MSSSSAGHISICGATDGRPWPQNGRDAKVELTYLAWNRKVQHILVTGRLDGVVVVYDLKKQRPIIELKDKAGCAAPPCSALQPPDTAGGCLHPREAASPVPSLKPSHVAERPLVPSQS